MIGHLLKLVWHRKRATALLMLEIAVSFLVVFLVAALALRVLGNWRRPLGYQWQDVWALEVDTNITSDDTWTPEQAALMQALLDEAVALPRVVASAGAFVVPYEFSSSNGNITYRQRQTSTHFDEVTDGFAATVGLRLVAGRWFGREDDGVSLAPTVINQRLARELFADEDPIGKVLERGRQHLRVVGVVDEFRQFGSFSDPDNYLFTRIPRLQARAASDAAALGAASPPGAAGAAPGSAKRWSPDAEESRPPRMLLLRVQPGTDAGYEQEVLRRLAPVAPGWSLEIKPLAAMRHTRLRFHMAPVVIAGVVAAFLLLMVALGLLGVLWQNVTRRTRELGLRRAAGASRAAVHRQVLLELFLITSLAVLPAVVLIAQVPLALPFAWLEPGLLAAAVAVALVVVYALSLLCGLYPSRIATRLPPAEALRWE